MSKGAVYRHMRREICTILISEAEWGYTIRELCNKTMPEKYNGTQALTAHQRWYNNTYRMVYRIITDLKETEKAVQLTSEPWNRKVVICSKRHLLRIIAT